MIRPILLYFAISLLPTVAFAQADGGNFDRFDKDNSGTLDQAELPQWAQRNFARIDADSDGTITREEFRQFLAQRRRRQSAEAGENVKVQADIPYADTMNRRQTLDLFLPKVPKADKLPVIVFIHGGGWRGGNKSRGASQLRPFVRTGDYAGVSVGYRLTDEAIWPAQIHDCKAAIRWVRANADKYGLDPDRIGVWGTSAGGHLVSMLGVSGDVPELEGDLGSHTDVDSKVTCVANFFGPANLRGAVGRAGPDRAGPNGPRAKLLGGPLEETLDKATAASPVTYVTPNDPPVLTVHGTADRVVPFQQGVEFDAILKKAGVTSYLVPVQGAGHGIFHNAAVDKRLETFFAKYLLDKDVEISTEAIEQRREEEPASQE